MLEWLLCDQYLRAFGKKLSKTMDLETSARVYQDLHKGGATALGEWEWDQRWKRVTFLDDVRDKLNDPVHEFTSPTQKKGRASLWRLGDARMLETLAGVGARNRRPRARRPPSSHPDARDERALARSRRAFSPLARASSSEERSSVCDTPP